MTKPPPDGSKKPSGEYKPPPILTHERSLLSKIAKGSEARDVLDQQLMQLGILLVHNLHILFKTARIHDRTNEALTKCLEAILTLVRTLAQDGAVILRLQNDFLFLDVMQLKIGTQHFVSFMEFIQTLNEWRIGTLALSAHVKKKDLLEFAYLLVTLKPVTDSLADLKQRMKDRHLSGIDVQESRRMMFKVGQKNEQAQLFLKSNYVKAAETVGEVVESVKQGRVPYFKRAKRVIQNIVDLLLQDEALALKLTTLRCYDQYTHNHSVNVSLLAIALGNRIGFPKESLAELGLAALFHDIGKSAIAREILNKSEEFTPEEWQQMYRHPVMGVVNLLRLRGFDQLPGRMAAASFEHHMNYDFSGYPRLSVPWRLSLTGRILMIADCYDAMSSSRVYRRQPMAPAKVLQFMLGKSGKAFDSVLVRLFVNCVGILPVGSLVLLDSKELAIVVAPALDRKEVDRPVVRLITNAWGDPIEGPEVDLTEKDFGGRYNRSVVQLVDNAEYRFDTSRYLV